MVRSKKIRIYPKPESRQRLNKYTGLSRYWYNKAIEYLRNKGTRAVLGEVRKIQKQEHPEWAFDCPQRIREHAMADACKAVKNAKLKYKTSKKIQKVSFRSKKDTIQCFGFDAQSVKANFVFNPKHRCCFHATEDFKTTLEGIRIVKEDNCWFLIVPQSINIKTPDTQRGYIVSLDPGIRTFITFYSPMLHGKIGEGDFQRIFRLCLHLDRLISKKSKAKCKAKRNINKAMQRLRWKIYNLVDDLHKKTAHFLVRNFENILIPTFETSQMSRKLHSKTARSMLSFAHYRFKQFLKAKAEQYSANVFEVSEAYTSKTCSYCGKLHNIGSKKVMKCSCGVVIDRDINGARGILLSSCFGGYTPTINVGNC